MGKNLVWITPDTLLELEPMARAEIIEQYRRAFNVINARMFGGGLPPIEILPGNEFEGDLSDASACFVSDTDRVIQPRIYLQFDDIIELGVNTGTISALFHEMNHYFCYERQIKDTDREGSYHNENFKKAVEEHGGISIYIDPMQGYSGELSTETAWAILNEL